MLTFSWDDDPAMFESRWITFEVRHVSGSCGGEPWTLLIEGNR